MWKRTSIGWYSSKAEGGGKEKRDRNYQGTFPEESFWGGDQEIRNSWLSCGWWVWKTQNLMEQWEIVLAGLNCILAKAERRKQGYAWSSNASY